MTKRERELVVRTGQQTRGLAERERERERREQALTAAASGPAQEHLPTAREDAPRPAAASGRPGTGRWNLYELEQLVDAANGSSEQGVVWSATLAALREHADYAGNLPAPFDALAEDVFGNLDLSRS